jgi:hypothetical protein
MPEKKQAAGRRLRTSMNSAEVDNSGTTNIGGSDAANATGIIPLMTPIIHDRM